MRNLTTDQKLSRLEARLLTGDFRRCHYCGEVNHTEDLVHTADRWVCYEATCTADHEGQERYATEVETHDSTAFNTLRYGFPMPRAKHLSHV